MPICNRQINNIDREQHELICNNAFRQEEFMDMIPCEICGRLVNYDNYIEHLNRCYSFTGAPDIVNFTEQLDSAISNLQNIINNNNLNDNDSENMEVDNENESDNDLPNLISDNEDQPEIDTNNVMSMFMDIINSSIQELNADNIIINPTDDYTELTNLSETV